MSMKTEIIYPFGEENSKIEINLEFQNIDVTFFNPMFGNPQNNKMGFQFEKKDSEEIIKYLIKLIKQIKKIKELG